MLELTLASGVLDLSLFCFCDFNVRTHMKQLMIVENLKGMPTKRRLQNLFVGVARIFSNPTLRSNKSF